MTLFGALPALGFLTAGPTDKAGYEAHIFKTQQGLLPYRLLRPEGYVPGKKYPLILFLHGAGERGSDNRQQLRIAGDFFASPSVRRQGPAWVVIPQCPADDFWVAGQLHLPERWPGRLGFEFHADAPMRPVMKLTTQLLDAFLASGQVDNERVYLAGVSLGAMGAFDLLSRRPSTFAAALAICGGGNLAATARYAKGLPIWVFHGSADPVVNVEYSRTIVKALRKHGALVRYSEYPGVGHNSWNKALAEPELVKWLLEQRRNAA